uniref:Uncharacterized protein n=1 Tax=Rhizophora mucronata TaxID=61149 RepID=A0A2P2N670_RHIMU
MNRIIRGKHINFLLFRYKRLGVNKYRS